MVFESHWPSSQTPLTLPLLSPSFPSQEGRALGFVVLGAVLVSETCLLSSYITPPPSSSPSTLPSSSTPAPSTPTQTLSARLAQLSAKVQSLLGHAPCYLPFDALVCLVLTRLLLVSFGTRRW